MTCSSFCTDGLQYGQSTHEWCADRRLSWQSRACSRYHLEDGQQLLAEHNLGGLLGLEIRLVSHGRHFSVRPVLARHGKSTKTSACLGRQYCMRKCAADGGSCQLTAFYYLADLKQSWSSYICQAPSEFVDRHTATPQRTLSSSQACYCAPHYCTPSEFRAASTVRHQSSEPRMRRMWSSVAGSRVTGQHPCSRTHRTAHR